VPFASLRTHLGAHVVCVKYAEKLLSKIKSFADGGDTGL